MSRQQTNKLYDMLEAGAVSHKAVVTACLSYMSEADVEGLMHVNEWCVDDEGSCGCPE